MPKHLSRRRLLSSSALIAGAAALQTSALALATRSVRARRLRLAVVGVWNRGWANLSAVLGEDVVALCDVDSNHLANAATRIEESTGQPSRARHYRDFRVMLDREQNLDGVVVATPDHTHAVVSAAALRRGLPVYCEKPLAHTIHEVRTLQRLARARGLATQMGTQIHAGENYRRVVELVRSGVLGEISEAHAWVGKSWSAGRFAEPSPAPAHLDWELWQGPVAARPHCAGLHPANWRRFWDYGTGTLGDMACHHLDVVHWALDLGPALEVVSHGPEPHPVGTPEWMHVTWRHHSRVTGKEVLIHWWDGGPRPQHIPGFQEADGTPGRWGDGQMFVGSQGTLLSDYGKHRLFPEERFAEHRPPQPSIPRSIGHHQEWLRAIREGTPTTCDFAYSGGLAEAVLLGNVAFRGGESLDLTRNEAAVALASSTEVVRDVEWDSNYMRVANVPEAARFLQFDYRDGWEL